MANRITGLSGMDTESMVRKLMVGEENKVSKLYKQRTQTIWKQEMYRNLGTQMSAFQNKFTTFNSSATNLTSDKFFAMKNFSIQTGGADTKAVSVKNINSVKSLEYTLSVDQLAQAQKMTGSSGTGGYAKKILTGDIDASKLDPGMEVELNLDGTKIKATLGDHKAEFAALDVGADTDAKKAAANAAKMVIVAKDLNDQFKAFGAGVTAADKVRVVNNGSKLSFETESGRALSVSSLNNNYIDNKSFAYDKDTANSNYSFDITGRNGTKHTISIDNTGPLDADGLVTKINDAINLKGINGALVDGKYPDAKLTATAVDGRIKFEALPSEDEFKIKETTTVDSGKVALTDKAEFTLNGKRSSEFEVGIGASTNNLSTRSVGEEFGLSDADLKAVTITVKGVPKTFEALGITNTMTSSEMLTRINDANLGVKASYNVTSGNYTFESTKTGKLNGFTLDPKAKQMFGIGATNTVEPQDALFKIDGSATSRESNTFTLEGGIEVTLNADSVSTANKGKDITIKSSGDIDSMIKGIKDFVSSYNTMLTTLTGKYSESRAKSSGYGYYEPLTDDEKSAMKEGDIKLWEDKAKQGLLSRDPILGKVVDQLRSAMTASLDIGGGKKMSLASIGIASTDWRDMGNLQVDETKLRKALENNPEDVAALFNRYPEEKYTGDRSKRFQQAGVAYKLDDIVNDATTLKSNPITHSAGYFVEIAGSENSSRVSENDLSRKIKEINEKIGVVEERNMVKEASYYRMFAQMEKAMTQAQNQQKQGGF